MSPTTTTILHAPQNHIFVDMENMKSISPPVLALKHLVVHLFLGPENKKLEVEVVEAILENSHGIRLIRSPKNGKNALDFILAYHLGQAAMTEPKAYFHILSKDTGFDSLVELLQTKKIKAKRHTDWESLHAALIPKPPPPSKNQLSPHAERVLDYLLKSPNNRPKKRATLVRQAMSYIGKEATEVIAEALVGELQRSKKLTFDEKGSITYFV